MWLQNSRHKFTHVFSGVVFEFIPDVNSKSTNGINVVYNQKRIAVSPNTPMPKSPRSLNVSNGIVEAYLGINTQRRLSTNNSRTANEDLILQ